MTSRVSRFDWGPSFENHLLCGYPLDHPRPRRTPRAGSEWIQGEGGDEDAWIKGWDHTLEGVLRWIPLGDTVAPDLPQTGWAGARGVQEFLEWAREKNTFRFVPDARYPDFYLPDTYLAGPLEDEPGLDVDATTAMPFTLRNPTYDFALAMRGLMDHYRPGALRPGTVMRGTVAHQINGADVLEEVAAGVLRERHWIDGERVTLMESARTNAYDFSNDLGHGSWGKTRLTASANSGIASPKGVASASSGVFALIETVDTGPHHISQTLPALTDNVPQTVSWWVRPSSRIWCLIQTVDKGGTNRKTWLNLSTGALGAMDAGHTVVVRGGLIGSGLPWWRISVTFNAASGGTTPTAHLMLATGDGVSSYTGDGVSQIVAWNPQFEVNGAFPTSDIVTASAVDEPRNADQLLTTFPWALQTMTPYLRFKELAHPNFVQASSTDPHLVRFGAATGRRVVLFKLSGGSSYQFSNGTVGGSNAQSLINLSPAYGNTIELLAPIHPNGAVQLFGRKNGGSVTSGSLTGALAFSPLSAQERHLASLGTGGAGDIGLIEYKLFPGVVTDMDAAAAA